MTYKALVRPSVLTQPTYQPGKPIEAVARELGLDPATVLKLASNENPLGPSPLAIVAVRERLHQCHLYPDGSCFELRGQLAAFHDLGADQFIVGNGSNEIMVLLAQAFLQPGDEVVFGSQAFIVYHLATLLCGATPVAVPMPEFRHDLDALLNAITERTKLVFLPSPNNPTGTANSAEEIDAFVEKLPEHVIFCFDEAYAEYLENSPDLRPFIRSGKKVFCTRTFSKIYGLAGLRIGYGYGSVELIQLLNQVRQPFNVNSLAQTAAIAALRDVEFVVRSRETNQKGYQQLTTGLARLKLKTFPSAANFIILEVENALKIFEGLQQDGIIVRPLQPYSMPNHLRISIGTPSQNNLLLQALERMLSGSLRACLIKE